MKRFVLDTSALVKAYVEEEGTPAVRALFDGAPAGSLIVCRLVHPEAVSAITRREREGRIASEDATVLCSDLFHDLNGSTAIYAVVEVNAYVAAVAAEIIRESGLRGFDAVHLAALRTLLEAQEGLRSHGGEVEDEFVFVTADRKLQRVAEEAGVQVLDPTSAEG